METYRADDFGLPSGSLLEEADGEEEEEEESELSISKVYIQQLNYIVWCVTELMYVDLTLTYAPSL